MYVRILRRNFDDRVHIAERRGEDEPMAGAHKLFDGPFGVGTFGDVFEIGRFDPVAKGGDDRSAADLMLIGPAEIADRPEIDEADFQFVNGVGLQCRCGNRQKCKRSEDVPFSHCPAPD